MLSRARSRGRSRTWSEPARANYRAERSPPVTWFRRLLQPPPPPTPETVQADGPAELHGMLWQLVRFVNSNAGRLPGEAVVNARRVTDTLREVIDTSRIRPLDVHTVISVKATLTDYLPTSLRTYLALDPTILHAP